MNHHTELNCKMKNENDNKIKKTIRVTLLTLAFPFFFLFALMCLICELFQAFVFMLMGTIDWAFSDSSETWKSHCFKDVNIKSLLYDFVGIYVDLPQPLRSSSEDTRSA